MQQQFRIIAQFIVLLRVLQDGNFAEIVNQTRELGLFDIEPLQVISQQAAHAGNMLAVFPQPLHMLLHGRGLALE